MVKSRKEEQSILITFRTRILDRRSGLPSFVAHGSSLNESAFYFNLALKLNIRNIVFFHANRALIVKRADPFRISCYLFKRERRERDQFCKSEINF